MLEFPRLVTPQFNPNGLDYYSSSYQSLFSVPLWLSFFIYIIFYTVPLVQENTLKSEITVGQLIYDFPLLHDENTLYNNDIIKNNTGMSYINQLVTPRYGIVQPQFNASEFFGNISITIFKGFDPETFTPLYFPNASEAKRRNEVPAPSIYL